jgi:hypothetical protein
MKVTPVRVGFVLGAVALASIVSTSCNGKGGQEEATFREIALETYEDKVAGGWLGQAIGVLLGEPTEFKWMGLMIPFDMEDFCRLKPMPEEFVADGPGWENQAEMIAYLQPYYDNQENFEKWTPDTMSDQDDLYVEFMFLHSIHQRGPDVTATEMAEDWLRYLGSDRVWGANKQGYSNFEKGIWPPDSGHPDNNIYPNGIDFQIESDLFGLINPGMPNTSNSWCDKVGHMMNYGDGVYAGMAVAAMYGEAFFESDPRKLVEHSLEVIPAESYYAKMIRDVLRLRDEEPDWQKAWHVLEEKWGRDDAGDPVMKLDVRINGAYVYMGLLYGDGDFWKSMNIAMRCGLDSDCNPSTVGGILGTALGMKAIPEKWAILRDLPIENESITEIYPPLIAWDDILRATVDVGTRNVERHGGRIEDGVLLIPKQVPVVPPLEQTERRYDLVIR